MEKEKTKNKQLSDQLISLQSNAGLDDKKKKEDEAGKEEKEEESSETLLYEVQSLRAKYTLANRRMLEMKQTLSGSKSEIVRLTRIIQKEVGEESSELLADAESSSNWVGRAQKISLLQAKIKV